MIKNLEKRKQVEIHICIKHVYNVVYHFTDGGALWRSIHEL